ncbi:MAG: nucleotidyltransferase family protein [Limnobacter sp.]|uniref:nucleotidyltransferase family protein n=1 Tax=Limnobacter sp. TaxID=2003368 RepID=UPI004038417A
MIDPDLFNDLEQQVEALPIKAAFVFGSYAKGTYTDESDIDVLVVTDELSKIGANAAFKPLGRKLNRKIDVLAISTADFAAIDQSSDGFWSSVLKNAIPLKT